MDLPGGLATCKRCGRIQELQHKRCQTCMIHAIESVFVHASDQPPGRIPQLPLHDDDDDLDNKRRSAGRDHESMTLERARKAVLHRKQRDGSISGRHVSIDLRPAQQMQMLSDFLETNFPSTRARAGLADRGSYLATLPDIEIASSPMLRTAIDTLCFAHIGAKTGDKRLVQRSQSSYGQVLASLITAVNRRNGDPVTIEIRTVITSIMLLCLYDDSIPLPFQGENGWATHYWGCQQLLAAHGPGFMRIDDPFDRMLFNSLRMPCFFLGVARRKTIAQGRPEWMELAEEMDPDNGTFTRFYRVAMQIPTMLERVDDVLSGRLPLDNLPRLCADLRSLRQKVVQWYLGMVKRSEKPHWELPELVDITDLVSVPHNEAHLHMASSSIFTQFFRYGLPKRILQTHTLCAMSCIVLECSMLRLVHFQPAALHILSEKLQDIEQRAFDQASNLCRSLHHYVTFDGLAYADFSEFLNDIALNFFEEYGATKELSWCHATRVAIRTGRQRIQTKTQPRTLCRMGDAGPGFAMAMHYKRLNLLPPA